MMEERPRRIDEPLDGEQWSGRGPASGGRVSREQPFEFLDWYPPTTEPKPPPIPPVASKRLRRWVLYAVPPALILVLLAGFYVFYGLKGERGRDEPVPQAPVQAPKEAPSEPPHPAPLSPEDRYYQTWYLLTRSAERESLRIRGTFETPEKMKREVEAMGPPVQGPLPFDHQRFFYFSITLEAIRGVLSPEFIVKAPSRFALVDDQGHRVQAQMLPELEERATFLEADGGGIAEAKFYLAFPKEKLSTSSSSLILEAPGRKSGETLILTWQLPIRYPE